MNKHFIDAVSEIISKLKERDNTHFQAFLGFDACIDNIVRVVKDKKENGEHGFYDNSREFGEFLISKENKLRS
jgi:hypothetical protein